MTLALESAPALPIAYFLAGLIKVFLIPAPVSWMNRGSRFAQAARGMVFGLPMPICSCGVLPRYETLMKRGVAPTAGVAFLIATPELGIDALLLSIPLLGSDLTMARLIAAIIVALAAGYILGRLMPSPQPNLCQQNLKMLPSHSASKVDSNTDSWTWLTILYRGSYSAWASQPWLSPYCPTKP